VEKAQHTVTILCRCLHVTPSGFYAWRRRPESTRAREDRRLKILVRASFDGSRRNYGSPRIHEDLIEQHVRVSRKRVVRLMQEDGLKARVRKRYKHTTVSDHDRPIADNLLRQTFTAAHESALGRGHHGVCDRDEREAVPRGDPRSLLPVCRRLGRQCGQ
jgi:putative transposase